MELVLELKTYERLRDENRYLKFDEYAPNYYPSQVAIVKTEPWDWSIDNLDYIRKYQNGIISPNENLFWFVYISIYPRLHVWFEKNRKLGFLSFT